MDRKFLFSLTMLSWQLAGASLKLLHWTAAGDNNVFCIQISCYLHTWCMLLPHDDQKSFSVKRERIFPIFANFPNIKKLIFRCRAFFHYAHSFNGKVLAGYFTFDLCINRPADCHANGRAIDISTFPQRNQRFEFNSNCDFSEIHFSRKQMKATKPDLENVQQNSWEMNWTRLDLQPLQFNL